MLARLCGTWRWCVTALAALLLTACRGGEAQPATAPGAVPSPGPSATSATAQAPVSNDWSVLLTPAAPSSPLPTPPAALPTTAPAPSSPAAAALRTATPGRPSATPQRLAYPAWATGVIRSASDLLNARQGDAQAMLGDLARAAGTPAPVEGSAADAGWARRLDLSGSGKQDWVVAIPVRGPMCMPWGCSAYVVIFAERGGVYLPAYSFSHGGAGGEAATLEQPAFLAAEDLNRDGKTELALTTTSCGAHTYYTDIIIGR